ncbi:transmembrane protein [Rhizoctonia solani]|uniref:Transmembrane protein n=1 Tax=Rhizoctonia solani TaxID=456999 RepID=A0A8H8P5P9_9AGAM|nr:uncharacterized protein RhiXN_06939 [Rhizoctonia solani]QRW24990.1 transmembrane protein [Rhizoctonia solani]
MESKEFSTEPLRWPVDGTESKELDLAYNSVPLLPHDPNAAKETGVTEVIHFLGSVGIAMTLLYGLNRTQLYLERQPRIKLADGSEDSSTLGALMILRWIGAAWTGPLCLRVMFFLAERNGVYRHDISWIISYGILPPEGLLEAFPEFLDRDGAISWVPNSSTLKPSGSLSSYTIAYTGLLSDTIKQVGWDSYDFHASYAYSANFRSFLVKNLNLPWGQKVEEYVFKRVTSSVARLDVNSTVDSIFLPYFIVKKIEWLSGPDNYLNQTYNEMVNRSDIYPNFHDVMSEPRGAALMANLRPDGSANITQTWSLLINVQMDHIRSSPSIRCSNCTFIAQNTTIPTFGYALNQTKVGDVIYELYGCFAYAKISFEAGVGLCRNCRVSAFSTVQNDTAMEWLEAGPPVNGAVLEIPFIYMVLQDMYKYLPAIAPLRESLPDPTSDLETYIKALLTRCYSSVWNSWTDSISSDLPPLNSSYAPALPTLQASVSSTRVYAWLVLHLLATLAGTIFLYLELSSKHLLTGDTRMVMFDIDSTEVPVPNRKGKSGKEELLGIKPDEDRWKVIIASGFRRREYS